MAESKQVLVVCPPLCFVFSKFNKLDLAKIKKALGDFFSAEEIYAARNKLMCDVEKIEVDKLPRLSNHRDSDGRMRAAKEIDDIILLITTLDEKKLLSQLPRYVVDNTDSIPTLRLEDGELSFLIKKLEKMEESLTHLQACYNKLHSTGENRQFAAGVTTSASAIDSNSGNRPVDKPDEACLPVSTAHKHNAIDAIDSNAGVNSWAARISSETAGHLSHGSDMDTDNGEYIEVVNSRRKKRRLNQSPQTPANTGNQQPTTRNVRKKQTLVIGRRGISSGATIFAAAKPLLNKEVFCIDNVSTELSVDDITQFVQSMNVRVISCYETRPRRTMRQRRNNEFPDDRKAFRLCIVKDDRKNLLDADNWPTNITVSKWFFKGQVGDTAAMTVGVNAESVNDACDPDKTVLFMGDDNDKENCIMSSYVEHGC